MTWRRAARATTARLTLGLSALLAATAGDAAGDPPTASEIQAARSLFAQAEKDESAGNWNAALDKLRRVAVVKLTPGIRFHLALCEEQLGQLALALTDYAAAEEQARVEGNAEVRKALEASLPALRARVPRLTLTVPASEVDLEVRLDDRVVPESLWGTSMPVDVGTHRVTATARERLPFATSLPFKERDAVALEIHFESAATSNAAANVASVETAPPSPASALAAPALSEHEPVPVAAVASALGTLVLAGAGVGALVYAGHADNNGEGLCPTRTDCGDLKSSVRIWDWTALGAWVGSATLAAVSIVLWTAPREHGEHAPAPTSGRATLRATPGGLRIEGSF
jgi:hypothetical protein